MGIKWEDIKLGVSPVSNNIYMGKSKTINEEKGHEMFTDKSDDMTDMVIKAVIMHMIGRKDNDGRKEYVSYCMEGIGELRWYDDKFKDKELKAKVSDDKFELEIMKRIKYIISQQANESYEFVIKDKEGNVLQKQSSFFSPDKKFMAGWAHLPYKHLFNSIKTNDKGDVIFEK